MQLDIVKIIRKR